MNILFITITLAGLFIGLWSWYRTKDVANPSTLTAIFFIVPLLFNRLKLSGLQTEKWDNLTYLIIIYFIALFVIIPGLLLDHGKFKTLNLDYKSKFFLDNKFISVTILFSIVIQLILNYLNSGYFIPTLYLKRLQLQGVEFHTINVTFWGLVIETTWIFIVGIGIINARIQKSKFIWSITTLSLLTPVLTRFSRMSVMLGLILVFFILYDLAKSRRVFYLRLLIIAIVFSLLGTYLMWYRWSAGGKYKVSIAKDIQYKGNPGPLEAYATFYGYFPLSFENIDRFVKKNKDDLEPAYGAYTFRPILAGVFKIQRIFPNFPMHEQFKKLRDPLTGAATVPTAVPEFTVDFGFKLSFIPMLIYALIGLFLYIDGRRDALIRVLYFVFAYSYILSAFQNFFISPRFLYIVLLVVSFHYIQKFIKLKFY